MIAATIPSIADQVRAAAACAMSARSAQARDVLIAARSAREVRCLQLRRALLELLAPGGDFRIPALCARLPAGLTHNKNSVYLQLCTLAEHGWVSSECAPNRRGINVGTGRPRLWRITAAGRVALVAAARNTDPTPTPTTGDH